MAISLSPTTERMNPIIPIPIWGRFLEQNGTVVFLQRLSSFVVAGFSLRRLKPATTMYGTHEPNVIGITR